MAWYDFIMTEKDKDKDNFRITSEDEPFKTIKKKFKRKSKKKRILKEKEEKEKKEEVIRAKNFELPKGSGITLSEASSSLNDTNVNKVNYHNVKGNPKQGYRTLLSGKAVNTNDSRNLEIIDYLATHRSALNEVVRHRINASVDVYIDNSLGMSFNVSNLLLDDGEIIEKLFLNKQFNMSSIMQMVAVVQNSIPSAKIAGGPILHVAKFRDGICTKVEIEFSFA